ncbi:MAG: DUF6526 family protein [Vicinamibacterales bacterium]
MTQSYEHHAHRPTLSAIAFFGALGALALLLYDVSRAPSLAGVALILLAVAVLTLTLISRVYTTKLQDRIIRTEMALRLARLGLAGDLDRLTIKQITALRFASDAEMPPLVARTLSEQLTPDQIKRAVTDWQPDNLRT